MQKRPTRAAAEPEFIHVHGAREHNLKVDELKVPKRRLVVSTLVGNSGSRQSRRDLDPATRLADIAFVVRDEWQDRGVGTIRMRRMAEIARTRGLGGFSADVLAGNQPKLVVFQNSGLDPQRPPRPAADTL